MSGRTEGRQGRAAIYIAVAALLGVVVGVGILWVRSGDEQAGESVPASTSSVVSSSPPVTSSSSAPSSNTDDVTGRAADGCLGGSDPYTAVLAAQQEATIDDEGAAAFARAVARWALAYPSDPNSSQVLTTLEAPNSYWAAVSEQAGNSDDRLRQAGYVSSRVEPASEYRLLGAVASDDPPRRAILQVKLTRVLVKEDGAEESADFKVELTLRENPDGLWSVVGSTPENLMIPETPTTVWVPYAGGC